MGLFTPKISQGEMRFAKDRLRQLGDTDKLIQKTVKPDVFFGRLNFMLDLFLSLKPFEKYKIFKPITPTQNYERVLRDMGSMVDEFIDRAVAENNKKIDALKTEKAKLAKKEKFAIALISAFDCANSFWTGDTLFPHYDGPLFTEDNYKRVQAIFDSIK